MATALQDRGNDQDTAAMLSLKSFERIGTFSFVTGLVTVFGIFLLLRTEPFSVVLTFLIVGIILVLLGVVLLSFSSNMINKLRKEESDCLLVSEEQLTREKPPSYETVVQCELKSLPAYEQAIQAAKQSLSRL